LGAENKDVKAPKTGLITNRRELNLAIKNGPNRKVGFLSEANYKSVHTVLHEGIEPEYFTDTEHLYDAVRAGTVIAGFISGVPDETEFQVFSSELISPRSFQMSKGPESRDLMEAVDAAVVRTHNLGELQLAARKNPPFEAVEVHTCRSDDPTKIPFPAADKATGLLKEVLTTRKLKILSYGNASALPDWKQDGNYKANPPTGFWPDYMRSFMKHFKAAYGEDIELERVWHKTAAGTEAVLSGDIHMTEPYYIYENLWNDRVKKWSFEFSCIVCGYDQKFFAKKTGTVISDGKTGCMMDTGAGDVTTAGASSIFRTSYIVAFMMPLFTIVMAMWS